MLRVRMKGPSGELITGRVGKLRQGLSSLRPTAVFSGRTRPCLTVPPLSPPSPFEIGMMLSTVILVKTGLGRSEPDTGGLWEYRL